MSEGFFQSPILNSPYEEPARHWELDGNGQPTATVIANRRGSALVSPIPKAKVAGRVPTRGASIRQRRQKEVSALRASIRVVIGV